jgi:TPR repeat protein
MYAYGEGVKQDYVLAHMWMNLSRAQHTQGANKNLQILVQRMTKEQIAEAQKMAREWQEKHQPAGGE